MKKYLVSDARKQLGALIKEAQTSTETIVINNSGDEAVLLSKKDFDDMHLFINILSQPELFKALKEGPTKIEDLGRMQEIF